MAKKEKMTVERWRSLSDEERQRIIDQRVAQSQIDYNALMSLRQSDPVRFTLCRIGAKWDDLNDYFEKNGIDDEFKAKRNSLKEFIRNCGLSVEVIAEYREQHRNHMNGDKFVHGYNFDYKQTNN